ncbi:MAG: aspartyl protease family protein, partial [Gemmataceae bacterium]
MALCFAYTRERIANPAVALGGAMTRPRPLTDVTLIGPGGTGFARGLLDTGADDTVFPEALAALIGIDLTSCPAGVSRGVGGAGIPVRFAPVTIRLTDGLEHREWTAVAGFSAARTVNSLLGFAGFLQFFTATFHGDDEVV